MPRPAAFASRRALSLALSALAWTLVSSWSCSAPPTARPPPGPPASATRSISALTMSGVGRTDTIRLVVKDANGTVLPNASVSWGTDNSGVAEASGSGPIGTITSRGPGIAMIQASIGTLVSYRGIDAPAALAVAPLLVRIPVTVRGVTSVTLAPDSLTVRVGDRQLVRASVAADEGVSTAVQWSSLQPALATVDADGTVHGVAVGRATVVATATADPRRQGRVTVIVAPGRQVTLSPATRPQTLWLGDTRQLTATVDVDAGESRAVQWTSDAPSIAAVSATGLVVARDIGTARIRATALAASTAPAEIAFTILPARTVTLSPRSLRLGTEQTRTITAAVTVEAGLRTAVVWRVETPSIASIASSLASRAVIRGNAYGTTTLTAISVADTTRRGTLQVVVEPVVRGVTITPTTATVFLGASRTLDVAVTADPPLSRAVRWRSSAPTIARVSAAGIVVGLTAGTAIITASSAVDSTISGRRAITVTPAPAIRVSPTDVTLRLAEQRPLTAQVAGAPGTDANVLWRTADASVATVSATGLVTAVGFGTTTATALLRADTTRRASATIRVTPVVRSITLAPTAVRLLIGGTTLLTSAVTADARLSTAAVYRSSNTAVASVRRTGTVTALRLGTTVITALAAADTTVRATATVQVTPRPITITMSPRDLTLTLGQTTTYTAVVNGDAGISRAVSWRSVAPGIASVSGAGVVTALAPGSTRVIATALADPTKQDSVAVTVAPRLATSWTPTRLGGPLYEDVISLVHFRATSAFAVNLFGDIFQWNGTAWAAATRGATHGTAFLAIDGNSPTSLVAVGTNGVVVQWDGNSWTRMTSNTTATLQGITVVDAARAVAVGANGTILQRSGGAWTARTTGSPSTLRGAWSDGSSSVAVGDGGQIWLVQAGTVRPMTRPTTETLYDIEGMRLTELTAVGAFGTILRYTNARAAWTKRTTTLYGDFYGVSGTGANQVLVSDDGLHRFDGTTLSTESTPYVTRMFSVSVADDGRTWAGGQRGLVLRSASGAWTTNNILPDLIDVWRTSATNAWAVGEFGTILQWNGAAWTRQSSPTAKTLNAVWGASPTVAFAGGDDGALLRWNGTSWTTMTSPSTASIYGMHGFSATDVYAVTNAGTVLHFDGSTWTSSAAFARSLWVIHGTRPSAMYAAGENGGIWRYTGSSWVAVSPTTTGTFAGLWMPSATTAVAVGATESGMGPIFQRFSGSAWATATPPSFGAFTSIWGTSAVDQYITGDQGTIVRYDGTTFQTMSTSTTDLLWSVTGAPTGIGGAFAVGYNSMVVVGSTTTGAAALRIGGSVTTLRGSLTPSRTAQHEMPTIRPLRTGVARHERRPAPRRETVHR